MDELEKIKRKKLRELQKRALRKKIEEEQKKREASEKLSSKNVRENTIMSWMTQDAYSYLKNIRNRDQRVSNIIEEVLIMLINRGVMRNKLTYQQLLIIERKIIGKGPTIKVKRAGKEIQDLTDEFKKNL
ncbi:MAG: hypothetical protein EU549_00030 [Promethearchaeota archaeon]|nr:MAG: hypothetical protein EU549_00030 [Candidatus Lokiarchaeota archaeon]